MSISGQCGILALEHPGGTGSATLLRAQDLQGTAKPLGPRAARRAKPEFSISFRI
jgi:hypothetical protein